MAEGVSAPPAYSDIALDSENNIHISSCIADHAGVWYAKGDRKSWHLSQVDSNTYYCSTSIAVDSNNNPHIAYNIAYSIRYATEGWEVEEVERGENVSICLDSFDNVYITCVEEKYDQHGDYSCALKYITKASDTWQSTSIFSTDSTDQTLYYSGIAIDSNNKLHIGCVYYEHSYPSSSYILYAENTSGSWRSFPIDPEKGDKGFLSIAVDSSDSIHFSYYDEELRSLKHATNASGTWQVFTLDSNGNTGWYSSIATDSIGCVHISYFNESTDNLMYATNREMEGK